MTIELKVPTVGESVNEITLSKWLVNDGDMVAMDQSICEFESDKATLEFPAEKSGKITFKVKEGADLKPGDVIATLEVSDVQKKEVSEEKKDEIKKDEIKKEEVKEIKPQEKIIAPAEKSNITPLAENIAKENKVDITQLAGSGAGGRITKDDVLNFIKGGKDVQSIIVETQKNSRNQREEKTSKLRKTVAKRLVQVKNETAMLTTFNEVDMSAISLIREKYKVNFEKKYGVGLGMMGFFVKACCNALLAFPDVNGYYNEDSIIFHDFCDISIAVSTPKGLVVPVVRNAESLPLHMIETEIKRLATKGREGTLSLEEMQGGTFTITNGGVFGSLMSTPIINAPQSAILGMHKIQERPVAHNGQVVIRPMMYVALSYDHRIVDGKESVSFLAMIKAQLEKPEQLLFGVDPVELLLDI